jgi:hypothetical protein
MCGLACAEKPPNPECSQPDCYEQSLLGFLPNGVLVDARISYSANLVTHCVAPMTHAPAFAR